MSDIYIDWRLKYEGVFSGTKYPLLLCFVRRGCGDVVGCACISLWRDHVVWYEEQAELTDLKGEIVDQARRDFAKNISEKCGRFPLGAS